MADSKKIMKKSKIAINKNAINNNAAIHINVVIDYITQQPEGIQPLLYEVRNALLEALPHAEERIAWNMPTYWDKHNIIHFAAFKKHIGLYTGAEAIMHFSEALKEFKTSKGAVQLPYDKPLPLKLIGEIAKWCYQTENHH